MDSLQDSPEETTILPIGDFWIVAGSQQVSASTAQFLDVTNLLLERVQLNSTHLFRADILYDSAGELKTLIERENGLSGGRQMENIDPYPAQDIQRFELRRTVLRRLIPRKPQLDKPLEQSCFVYQSNIGQSTLVVYTPHCSIPDDIPWYHPKVKALAYLFTPLPTISKLSVQYLPFSRASTAEPSSRLDRTFLSLLNTMTRLLKLPPSHTPQSINSRQQDCNILTTPLTAASLRDTILPQHIVQNTYARLKQTYAPDLISRWIEKTEPSKHVFEDLSIAAFLISLWNTMYDIQPHDKSKFPGFVDLACGNGVLVYVLIHEGYRGYGFDARRRKTWEVLDIEKHVEERVCIPRPFLEALSKNDNKHAITGLSLTSGRFPPGTFMISNHADELTCWTPILAALSCPERPLPFLAIPCCSHALDGSRHRYTLKDVAVGTVDTEQEATEMVGDDVAEEQQPVNGDLKALRKAKQKELAGLDDKSMYTCLTRKTAALAQELGMDVELTLMRIPSTRNIGIVGNRKQVQKAGLAETTEQLSIGSTADTVGKIKTIVDRECQTTGGVNASAQTWADKARKLQAGQGRGKVNLKMKG